MKLEAATLAALSMINPAAAFGAVFGCVLHLFIKPDYTASQKTLVLISSWGIGYGCGILYANEKAFIVSLVMAALGSTLVAFANRMISNGEDLPLWFKSITDIIMRNRK